ncbi:hypothetical protein AB0M58_13430 [Streptomyces bobili]|uniref:hypothetical protein n=1 Tax=Streptomyces bobili TaxID=67280 RepID=UPI00344566C6
MIEAGLRNTAKADQSRAAIELLIKHGTWVEALMELDDRGSANSIVRYAMMGVTTDEDKPYLHLEWTDLVQHLTQKPHTYSETEVKILLLAASLFANVPVEMRDLTTGLDPQHAVWVVAAVASAAGAAGSGPGIGATADAAIEEEEGPR